MFIHTYVAQHSVLENQLLGIVVAKEGPDLEK